MEKKAQNRQRNSWNTGDRNKWNRAIDGYKDNTPWRIGRDQFFDFTKYAPDAISFDADPNHVYSGEALWRMYVMDKFYREYKTEDGRWVGGYINDRFHVFPDAGTPGNPDTPRDGGNQMELGLNERTRKPRPHQYSVERRMEEARGNKTHDLEVTTTAKSFNKIFKTSGKVPVSRKNDKVYSIFNDYLEMKEAGIKYENSLELISDHYDLDLGSVAEIFKLANKMVKKHNKMAYSFINSGCNSGSTFIPNKEIIAISDDQKVRINENDVLVCKENAFYDGKSGAIFYISYSEDKNINKEVFIPEEEIKNLNCVDEEYGPLQDAANELGLNDIEGDLNVDVNVDVGGDVEGDVNVDLSTDNSI
jgi:hypothetical protein